MRAALSALLPLAAASGCGSNPCPASHLCCHSEGTCLDVANRCDGTNHCPDGSDEAGCDYLHAVWPTTGTSQPTLVSNTYGPRLKYSQSSAYDFHRGIDIPCAAGGAEPVYAVSAGTIYKSGAGYYSDPMVQIQHTAPDGTPYYSTYMHMYTWLFDTKDGTTPVGTPVAAGQAIGTCGPTGGPSNGASGFWHVHFEVRRGGTWNEHAVHPLRILPYYSHPGLAAVPAAPGPLQLGASGPPASVATLARTEIAAVRDLGGNKVEVTVHAFNAPTELNLVEIGVQLNDNAGNPLAVTGQTAPDATYGYPVMGGNPSKFHFEEANLAFTHRSYVSSSISGDGSSYSGSNWDLAPVNLACPLKDHASSPHKPGTYDLNESHLDDPTWPHHTIAPALYLSATSEYQQTMAFTVTLAAATATADLCVSAWSKTLSGQSFSASCGGCGSSPACPIPAPAFGPSGYLSAVWPTTGTSAPSTVSSTYGPRLLYSKLLYSNGNAYDFHRGVDINCAATSSPVYAASAGTVKKRGHHSSYTDPLVQLEHTAQDGSKYFTNYMHLSSWDACPGVGAAVSGGQQIGTCGAASSNADHVHVGFEVRVGSTWRDDAKHPYMILPSRDTPQDLATSVVSVERSSGGHVKVVLATATTPDELTLAEVGAEVRLSDGTLLPTAATTVAGYATLGGNPAKFNFEEVNKAFTHRSTGWPGDYSACPLSAGHGSSYDADVHLEVADWGTVKMDPDVYVTSSTAYKLTSTFVFDSSADVALDTLCVKASSVNAAGNSVDASCGCPSTPACPVIGLSEDVTHTVHVELVSSCGQGAFQVFLEKLLGETTGMQKCMAAGKCTVDLSCQSTGASSKSHPQVASWLKSVIVFKAAQTFVSASAIGSATATVAGFVPTLFSVPVTAITSSCPLCASASFACPLCGAPAYPDLQITAVEVSGTSLLKVTQHNAGSGNAIGDGHTYIYIDDMANAQWTYSWTTLSDTAFKLAGGSSPITPQTLCGTHTVKACIDPNNVVTETDEANNCLTESLTFPACSATPPCIKDESELACLNFESDSVFTVANDGPDKVLFTNTLPVNGATLVIGNGPWERTNTVTQQTSSGCMFTQASSGAPPTATVYPDPTTVPPADLTCDVTQTTACSGTGSGTAAMALKYSMQELVSHLDDAGRFAIYYHRIVANPILGAGIQLLWIAQNACKIFVDVEFQCTGGNCVEVSTIVCASFAGIDTSNHGKLKIECKVPPGFDIAKVQNPTGTAPHQDATLTVAENPTTLFTGVNPTKNFANGAASWEYTSPNPIAAAGSAAVVVGSVTVKGSVTDDNIQAGSAGWTVVEDIYVAQYNLSLASATIGPLNMPVAVFFYSDPTSANLADLPSSAFPSSLATMPFLSKQNVEYGQITSNVNAFVRVIAKVTAASHNFKDLRVTKVEKDDQGAGYADDQALLQSCYLGGTVADDNADILESVSTWDSNNYPLATIRCLEFIADSPGDTTPNVAAGDTVRLTLTWRLRKVATTSGKAQLLQDAATSDPADQSVEVQLAISVGAGTTSVTLGGAEAGQSSEDNSVTYIIIAVCVVAACVVVAGVVVGYLCLRSRAAEDLSVASPAKHTVNAVYDISAPKQAGGLDV